MKKFLTLALAAILAISLTGCSEESRENNYQNDNNNYYNNNYNNNQNNNNYNDNNNNNVVDFGGGTNGNTQDAILQYINKDLVPIAELETTMLNSYSSVSGSNYTDDQTMYNTIVNTTLPLAKQLNEKALSLVNTIDDPELLMVHKKYVEYSSKMVSSFALMVTALDTQDVTMVTNANEKLNEANSAGIDFKAELTNLAKKYNVKFG